MGKKRTQVAQVGATFDAGALIAIERGDRRMIALLQEIVAQRVPVRVPAGVIGQVWRDPARQVVISRLLRAHEVEVRALDDQLARACGVLCALTGDNDVIDASVVLTAREHGDRIFTSDPDDLRRLDPSASIHKV